MVSTTASSSTKVLLVANTGWYLYNFRLPLARYLRDHGYEVVFASPPDAYVEQLMAERFRWVLLDIDRRSRNPFKELRALYLFWQLYRREKPRVCHHFTVKCVLYGTVAAKLSGVGAVVNAITGLGHAFLGNSWLNRAIRPFLRAAYRRILTARRVQVIFQNGDDYQEFQDRGLINPEKTTIIRGSGVDLRRFSPRPGRLEAQPAPSVVLASRLIREKGVAEFVEAARLLHTWGVSARFCLAGKPDPGNPSSISEKTLNEWCREGAIDYLGHIDCIEDVLEIASLVVLPSYREGTPKILLEAAAMGKPLVATDVPGCREVVRDGYNGLLVKAGDPVALARAIQAIMNDPERARQFAENSRALAAEFCETKVIAATAKVYERARSRSTGRA